ncbi:type II toxin-antitoxin system RelE/ParE family toxin [Epilithonimonas hispanica]|uniref:Type II toxin-antitoxin system RelE/ParE family toxin n=1 Tax=Epilithonimonas hispanica TaxID=358687 RepID=A0A3D9CTU8_9FLAO|nr:type II toxin-antitoxin system RelE/ParE family toxin [Epilithonimonas hispanica]REC69205.1 type II toxin-antitoxin system RelE/ParE family toxin [Epilithonimonas hispanica]
MAKRKINWTEKANLERKEILQYWITRNKSKRYSVKLNKLFGETLKKTAENPMIGRKTDFNENIRVKIVRDYLLFYKFDDKQLKVLSIWDGNRDDNKLEV